MGYKIVISLGFLIICFICNFWGMYAIQKYIPNRFIRKYFPDDWEEQDKEEGDVDVSNNQ
jgi:amino acid permease